MLNTLYLTKNLRDIKKINTKLLPTSPLSFCGYRLKTTLFDANQRHHCSDDVSPAPLLHITSIITFSVSQSHPFRALMVCFMSDVYIILHYFVLFIAFL